MKTMKAKKAIKVTYAQASLMASESRQLAVKDAQDKMRSSANFTDAVFFGYPLEIGPDKPAIGRIGWRRPCDTTPSGCTDIARIPVSGLSELHACRMLANKMENFPFFNCDAIA